MTRTTRWVSLATGCALLVGGGFWLGVRRFSARDASRGGAEAPAVPVVVATVARREVPIFLEGMGNVTAAMTVTVKTQLDGRLEQVVFQEGQEVRRGQLLAQLDARPYQVQLEQAQGALARDEAQLQNARLNVQRDLPLAAGGFMSQQQQDTDRALAAQLEGAVRVDQAAVHAARLNLDYARITSPIDGVTGVRLVDPGNLVRASDPGGIAVVTQLDPISVVFTLPQDRLTPVRQELLRAGTLPVEVLSGDRSEQLGSGRLTLVDNQINQATSTIRLKATLPNPRHLLWPNQFVNVRLRLTTRKDALVLPASTLQRGPAGAFVYVVGAGETAAARPVTVVETQGELALLSEGVQPGEQVVTEGQDQLHPGARVTVRQQQPEGDARAQLPNRTAEREAAAGAR